MVSRSKRPVVAAEPSVEINLYPSRKAWLLVLVISLAFCAASIIPISRGEWMGWFGLAFFGLGAIISLALVLFPQIFSLRIAAEGFYIKSLFSTHFTRWQDVSYFGVGTITMNTMVVFNYSASYSGQKFGRKLAFDLAGWEGALSDTYGMSAQDLADLMNAWKRRSNSGTNTSEPLA